MSFIKAGEDANITAYSLSLIYISHLGMHLVWCVQQGLKMKQITIDHFTSRNIYSKITNIGFLGETHSKCTVVYIN